MLLSDLLPAYKAENYFLFPLCVIAATAVGLGFDADGESCEFSNEPSFMFNWKPETVLPRKLAVKMY